MDAGRQNVRLLLGPSVFLKTAPSIIEITLTASRLYAMVRERGYSGGEDHFRHLIAHHRPRPQPEAYLRLKTLPAEQGQVDWGHFGKVTIGQVERTLMAFVLVYRSVNIDAFMRPRSRPFCSASGRRPAPDS